MAKTVTVLPATATVKQNTTLDMQVSVLSGDAAALRIVDVSLTVDKGGCRLSDPNPLAFGGARSPGGTVPVENKKMVIQNTETIFFPFQFTPFVPVKGGDDIDFTIDAKVKWSDGSTTDATAAVITVQAAN